MSKTVISVKDLHVGYDTPKGFVPITKKINFEIKQGEIFGLIGESGSGKTTVARALMKIHEYQEGSAKLFDKEISEYKSKADLENFRKSVQMVFQDPYSTFNPKLPIHKVVGEGLDNYNLYSSKEERREKIVNALKSVGSGEEFLNRFPHEFSGGQRQRIAIARALVMDPKLIIADEPVSALDVSIQAQVLNLIKNLVEERDLAMLFIAHDLGVVKYLCDNVAIMHKGAIVEYGNAEAIFNNPQHPYTVNLVNAIPHADPDFEKEKNVEIIDFEFDPNADFEYKQFKDENHYYIEYKK